jgi:hypothetical protein
VKQEVPFRSARRAHRAPPSRSRHSSRLRTCPPRTPKRFAWTSPGRYDYRTCRWPAIGTRSECRPCSHVVAFDHERAGYALRLLRAPARTAGRMHRPRTT